MTLMTRKKRSAGTESREMKSRTDGVSIGLIDAQTGLNRWSHISLSKLIYVSYSMCQVLRTGFEWAKTTYCYISFVSIAKVLGKLFGKDQMT